MENLEQYIREIPDFPRKGISYKDITPILQNPHAMRMAVNLFLKELGDHKIDKVVGIESRGFFFASLLAQKLDAGLVPIRKSGKLPYATLKEVYELEYGKDVLEIHEDAIKEGENVLIHDDVLATGGTAAAACNLVRKLGGNIVQCNFLLELKILNGRAKINRYDTVSLVSK